ncbi:MAG: PAS domain-containing protein [Bacteroidota bacterium]
MLLEKNHINYWLEQSHVLTMSLTEPGSLRKRLPRTLSQFAQVIGAGQAVFIEFAPQASTTLSIKRILSVSLTSGVDEQPLSTALGRIHFPEDQINKWLAGFETDENGVIHHTRAGRVHLENDQLSRILLRQVDVIYESFALFPLCYETDMKGLLFLSSARKQCWLKEGLLVCKTATTLLSRLLAQEYRAIKKTYSEVFQKDRSDNRILSVNEISGGSSLLKTVASTIPDYIFLVDLATSRFVFSNVDNFLGYDFATIENSTDVFVDQIHPDDKEAAVFGFIEKLQLAGDDEIIESAYRMRHYNGSWVWISERARIFQRFDDGIVHQYLTTIQEITKMKEAQLKVEESRERYRNFLDYSTEGIYYINCGEPIKTTLPKVEQVQLYFENAFLQECNEVAAQWDGFEQIQKAIGTTVATLGTDSLLAMSASRFEQFVESGYKLRETSIIQQLSDGKQRYLSSSANGIFENGLLIGIWGVHRNLTAKRTAEIALQQSEMRLSSIIQDAKMGIWEWQMDEPNIKVNEEILRILAFKKYKHALPRQAFESLLGEEGRATLTQQIEYHIKHRTDNFQSDISMNLPNGQQRWVQVHGRFSGKTADGKAARMTGMLLDIHDLKVAELQVEEGEALLKAVLQAMPDIKLRMHRQGEILSVYTSDLDASELQITTSRVVGKNLTDILPVFVARGIIFNAGAVQDGKEMEPFEFINHGALRVLWVSAM